MSVVLITTANRPPSGVPHLQLVDSASRRLAARSALGFWILSGIKKVVIVDATDSVLFSPEEFANFDIEVEQLSYQQNTELVQQRGKGYGEARLLEYALNNSVLLNSESSFYKCTGKVYCRNFAEISRYMQGKSSCFWQHYDDRVGFNTTYVDTRFFYSSLEFAVNSLVPKLLEADDRVKAVEHCCYELLVDRVGLTHGPRSKLSGLAGGSGRWYSEYDLGYIDSNYPMWVW